MYPIASAADLAELTGPYYAVGLPDDRERNGRLVCLGRLGPRPGETLPHAALRAPRLDPDGFLLVTEDTPSIVAAAAVLVGRATPDSHYATNPKVGPRLSLLSGPLDMVPPDLLAVLADTRTAIADRCHTVLDWIYTGKIATCHTDTPASSTAGQPRAAA